MSLEMRVEGIPPSGFRSLLLPDHSGLIAGRLPLVISCDVESWHFNENVV
jgi:hypothetical protein